MKYTSNYHLPQWSEDDLILMDDFNKMNESIEAGISGNAAGVAEAKEAAEKARAAAVGAQNTADSALTAKPYVTGSYTGNYERQEINLGFRPSFVIISSMHSVLGTNNVSNYMQHFAVSGGHAVTDRVNFTDTGFVVLPSSGTSVSNVRYPDLVAVRIYDYIAFK